MPVWEAAKIPHSALLDADTMPRPHILLASQTREGLAVPISAPRLTYASAHTSGLAARLERQPDGLLKSFGQAGDLAWRVLMCSPLAVARGADEPSRFGYQLEIPGTEQLVDTWGSADLAFFVTALLDRLALACSVELQISPLAATGELFGVANPSSESPTVQPVIGITSKLRAAIEAFAAGAQPETARILIPRGNLADLSPEHLAWKHRGVIVPVYQLEDVLDALKALPVLSPAMRDMLKDLHAPFRGNPYRGIEAFGIEHRGRYFGRQKRIDEVLSKLPDAVDAELPAVLITGFSGSGKSSLMLAGVLGTVLYAEVKGHRFLPLPGGLDSAASVAWRVPARADITEASLCDALRKHWQALGLEVVGPVETLSTLGDRLIPLLNEARPSRWVFALDQLEGLVTQVGQDDAARQESDLVRDRFARFLDRLTRDAGVWVIASLRGYLEALGPKWKHVFHAAEHIDLGQIADAAVDTIEAERQQFLHEVIERPAMLAGFRLEEGLREELIRDASDPQSLPLLQFALQALYDNADQRRGQSQAATLMTRADYQSIGGIRSAINQRANQLLASASNDREVLLGALARLAREQTEASGRREYVRATVAWKSYSEREQFLLEPWFNTDHRLLTHQSEQVEVAHEALLREFTALREWLLTHAQLLRWRQDHLLPQMRRWLEREKRDILLLLTPDDLELGAHALRQPQLLAAQEAHFVRASLNATQQRSKRALRRTQLGLVVAIALLFAAVLFGLRAREATLKREEQLQEASSRALIWANNARDTGDRIAYYAFLAESLSFVDNPLAITTAEAVIQWPILELGIRPFRVVAQTGGSAETIGSEPSVQFSIDSRWILTASRDGSARIWDTQSGIPVGQPMNHGAPVFSAQFSPDGRWVATASADSTARIWESHTGKQHGESMQHHGHVTSVRFSQDSERIVTVSENKAQVWNVHTGLQIGRAMSTPEYLASAEFSPDGVHIVTSNITIGNKMWDGSPRGTRVWNAQSGQPIGQPMSLEIFEHANRHARVSPNGRWIVTKRGIRVRRGDGRPRTAKLLDLTTDQTIGSPIHESHYPYQFSPDSQRVLTVSKTGTAQVWSVPFGEPDGAPMHNESPIKYAEFSPDGRWIITGTHQTPLQIWNAQSGDPVGSSPRGDAYAFDELHMSPDGRWMATATRDGTVRVWGTQTGTSPAAPLRYDSETIDSTVSPDGRWIATTHQDATARIWDAQTGALVGASMEHQPQIAHIAFSHDSSRIVTAGFHGRAQMWAVVTGLPIGKPMHDNNEAVIFAEFSPDDSSILTIGLDGMAQLWNAKTQELSGTQLLHTKDSLLRRAMFSPDGHSIVTCDLNERIVRIWDIKTGTSIPTTHRHKDRILSVVFSPDSRLIATSSSDTTAQVWDARTGEPIGKPMSHGGEVQSAQFSPNGSWVLTSSSKAGTVNLWEAQTGAPIGPPILHDSVCSAEFSPNSRWVLTAGVDGSARVWDSLTGTMIGMPLLYPFERSRCTARFSPDGNWIVTAGGGDARIWPFVTDLGADRSQLALAIRALSGVEIDATGRPRNLTLDEILKARNAIQAVKGDTAFAQVIRWHFADPSTRTISPFAKKTVSQLIDNTIDEALAAYRHDPFRHQRQRDLLNEAYQMDPGHPLILLALSRFEWRPDTSLLWKQLTLKRIAAEPLFAGRAAKLFEQLDDRSNARRAAEIALGLDPTDAKARAVLDWSKALMPAD